MTLTMHISNKTVQHVADLPSAGTIRWPSALQLLFSLSFAVLVSGCATRNAAAPAMPPPSVQVAQVIQRDVPVYHEYVATLDGFVNAQIQPQVSGYLVKQSYQEGQRVQKNQVLF